MTGLQSLLCPYSSKNPKLLRNFRFRQNKTEASRASGRIRIVFAKSGKKELEMDPTTVPCITDLNEEEEKIKVITHIKL